MERARARLALRQADEERDAEPSGERSTKAKVAVGLVLSDQLSVALVSHTWEAAVPLGGMANVYEVA